MKNIFIICAFLTLLFSTTDVSAQKSVVSPVKVDLSVKQDELRPEKDLFDKVKDWLVPASTFLTIISIGAGVLFSLYDYRLKLRAERRLANSATVESNVKLMTAFTEMLAIAHSRKGSYLSEKAVEKMFEHKAFTDDEIKNPELIAKKLESAAVLNTYSGLAEQDALIAAVAVLGMQHEILKQPAIQALETMRIFKKDLAEKYLAKINASSSN